MPTCKLLFDCEAFSATDTDQARSATKTNTTGLSTTFTTTSGKGGTLKSLGSSSNVKGFISGYQFGSTDGYDLSSTYTRTNATAWGFLMVFSGVSSYTDKYIIDGGANSNYIKFNGSGELSYRSGGSKGSVTNLRTSTTQGGVSTAHTFGSGLEVVLFQVDTGANGTIWNVNGDKIFTGSVSGGVASFVVESLFHDGTFNNNPAFMLHEFLTWEGAFSDAEASTIASAYGRYD